MAITVLVTDPALAVVGDPLPWTAVDATLRFNEPGSGSITCPAWPAVMDQLAGGNRLTIIRDGAVFAGGPIEGDDYAWQIGDDPGEIVASFAEDLALVAGRVTYPDPALGADSGSQPDYWTVSAVAAGTAMLALADDNAGPSALTARRVPALTIGAGTGIGTAVSYRSRWQPLCDDLRTLATAGGGLGFRTVPGATEIEFEVYAPVDRSTGAGAVRYSRALGNLRQVGRKRQAPTITAAVVGGGGELADRVVRYRTDSAGIAAWWLVEQFVDQRQTSVTAELDQAGDEALTGGAETVALSMVTVDTATQQFGTHYGLGDKVAVEPIPGFDIADVVRAVRLQATADGGEQITSTVGTSDARAEPAWIRQMRALDRRLGRLEAR